MRHVLAGALAGALALATGYAIVTDSHRLGNEERWRACIALVYENPGAGGDLSYEACDAMYDPDQQYYYFQGPPVGCWNNEDGSATCQDDTGGWHFDVSPWE